MNRRKADMKLLKMNRKSHLYLMVIGVLSVIILMFAFSSFADAHNDREKLYTSVRVEEGDTLWSLANEYSSVEYKDNNSYIKEVKKLNHISDEVIHEGSYLVLPYYE